MCSETKTWECVVQCRSTVSIRDEIILQLHEDLKILQVPVSKDEELRILIEETRKFMKEDFETNKKSIGMEYLFRVFRLKCGNEQNLEATNTKPMIE